MNTESNPPLHDLRNWTSDGDQVLLNGQVVAMSARHADTIANGMDAVPSLKRALAHRHDELKEANAAVTDLRARLARVYAEPPPQVWRDLLAANDHLRKLHPGVEVVPRPGVDETVVDFDRVGYDSLRLAYAALEQRFEALQQQVAKVTTGPRAVEVRVQTVEPEHMRAVLAANDQLRRLLPESVLAELPRAEPGTQPEDVAELRSASFGALRLAFGILERRHDALRRTMLQLVSGPGAVLVSGTLEDPVVADDCLDLEETTTEPPSRYRLRASLRATFEAMQTRAWNAEDLAAARGLEILKLQAQLAKLQGGA